MHSCRSGFCLTHRVRLKPDLLFQCRIAPPWLSVFIGQLCHSSRPSSAVYDSVADFGAVVIRWIERLGDMTLFAWRTLVWLFTRLPRRDTLIPTSTTLAC